MKRYLLFAGAKHFPHGGAKDLIYPADSIQDCKEFYDKELKREYEQVKFGYKDFDSWLLLAKDVSWAHIYDTHQNIIVWDLHGKIEINWKQTIG